MKTIARIYTDFPEKFGIPRQSGLSSDISRIVFEKPYRVSEALRGIEDYSHIWLIWSFSENENKEWSPTVRPPRLGGNKRIGVFATRSPFRPNPIGLSCVELLGVEHTKSDGDVLIVRGADLLCGTPIFDIKPYLPYVDCKPDARGSFAEQKKDYFLEVDFPDEFSEKIPEQKRNSLCEILSQDPRPSYIEDEQRIYGMKYAGFEIKFSVCQNKLYVKSVEKA